MHGLPRVTRCPEYRRSRIHTGVRRREAHPLLQERAESSPLAFAHTRGTRTTPRAFSHTLHVHTLHVHLSRLPTPHSHPHATCQYLAPFWWARDEKAVVEKGVVVVEKGVVFQTLSKSPNPRNVVCLCHARHPLARKPHARQPHARQPHLPRCASCGAFATLAPPPAARADTHTSDTHNSCRTRRQWQ